MKSWSIPLGRVFGIDLRIDLTFAFLLAFVYFTQPSPRGALALERSVGLLAIVFASVLLHELGHVLASIRWALPVRTVVLLPIGGVVVPDGSSLFEAEVRVPGEMPRWQREVRVALAGPAVSLLVAFMTAAVVVAVAPEVRLRSLPLLDTGNLLRSLVWANLLLGCLNLLPAYPLDGGRALRAVLARKMDFVQATRHAVALGQAFSMAFIFAGLWNTWLMLLGFFLFVGAQLEERTVLFRTVLENVRMGDVMLTDFASLSPADTLEDALRKAVHSLQDDFPVIRGTDLVGVISRQNILRALREQGNGYVQAAMDKAYEVAGANDSLASVFRKLTARGLTLVPVVEQERLVGIVTLQNLMHSMSLLAETRRLSRRT